MISVDLEELIAFGIKQEVKGGVPYRRRTGSPKQYVTYSCSYPLCKAKFRVEEQNGVFTISKVNEEHCHHIGVEMGSHYASKFYQKWIELYIKNGGKQFLAQKAFFDKFGIDTNNKETIIIRQITESELKQKVTQCICQPNNFTKQKLKLLVKLTILILTIKKLNFIFYLKKSSYII
ncbi:hypothetical protein TVAG_595670 [Trichomonas vaginalis G3]|uniref:Uncharacterized protein n=1 Tax=Trichomonas vaginalis (strain ATCC PRA-98 / G3) TaxID=412133 RepID=A2HQN7_TRIV3|nr:hypothetical protein TVAG_595670 [Trichomonas vaginalis G3]|eukprot:XP_001281210.1 hypothetical protein [Trichomonas vaginalis G3]